MRQAGETQPELCHRLHDGRKILEISRLAQVTVRPKFVAARNVGSRLRRGEDNHWDSREPGFRPEFLQHRPAILTGQVQIEDHQIRDGRIGVISLMAQKRERFDPVVDAADMKMQLARAQDFPGKVNVGRVVVDQQNFRVIFEWCDRKRLGQGWPAT